MLKKKYCLLWLCLVFLLETKAQEPLVKASLDSASIYIGEQVQLSLGINKPQDLEIAWPEFHDKILGGIEIINKSEVDSSFSGEWVYLERKYTLTCFDSGQHTIPSLVFKDVTGGVEYMTAPLSLEVLTVAVDTTAAIKGIKPPIAVPYSWEDIWPWLLLIVCVLLLLGVLLWVWVKRKRQEPLFSLKQKAALPPEQVALEALLKMKKESIWLRGEVKFFFVELTEVLRNYLTDCHDIEALEMTSAELISALQAKVWDREQLQSLQAVLSIADLVKFAKEEPDAFVCESSLRKVMTFVDHSKPNRELSALEEVLAQEEGVVENDEVSIKE